MLGLSLSVTRTEKGKYLVSEPDLGICTFDTAQDAFDFLAQCCPACKINVHITHPE